MAAELDIVAAFGRFRFGIGLVLSLLGGACSGTEGSGPTEPGMPPSSGLRSRTRCCGASAQRSSLLPDGADRLGQ